MNKTAYKKIPHNNTYRRGYVVAIRDPLNLHVDIQMSEKDHQKYKDALSYEYEYMSEEHEDRIQTGRVYVCHLKNVEICGDKTPGNDAVKNANMKDAYIYLLKSLKQTQNWVLVSMTDIDTYSRILINVFNIQTKKSINLGMLEERSTVYEGKPIAKKYDKNSKSQFKPKNKKPFYQIEK